MTESVPQLFYCRTWSEMRMGHFFEFLISLDQGLELGFGFGLGVTLGLGLRLRLGFRVRILIFTIIMKIRHIEIK